MNSLAGHAFQKSVEELTLIGQQRVWSIIVTLFGDLAQRPGDQISGPLMSRITDQMGIRPEAMRVALHRLRKDGWIKSKKVGRTSYYSLTNYGLVQSAKATPRIYAQNVQTNENWHVVVTKPMTQTDRQCFERDFLGKDYVVLGTGVYLGNGAPSETLPEVFALEGSTLVVPNWLKETIAPAKLVSEYESLEKALLAVAELVGPDTTLTPLEIATLRTLVVHNWRRNLLRHPELPESFYSKDWRENECRALVHQLLGMLKRPSLRGLERTT